jgi:hypothetical protein
MGPNTFLSFGAGFQKQAGTASKRRPGALRDSKLELSPGRRELTDEDEEQAEVETDGLGVRKAAHQRPEPGEGDRRTIFVEEADRSRDLRLRVVRRDTGRRRESSFRGDRPQHSLVADTPREQALDPSTRTAEGRNERRIPRWLVGMEAVRRTHGGRRVGLDVHGVAPRLHCARLVSASLEFDAELQPDERAVRMLRSLFAQALNRVGMRYACSRRQRDSDGEACCRGGGDRNHDPYAETRVQKGASAPLHFR